ncbi:MAG: hypothetical protein COY92_07130 [Shewanella sp. CG_4_10_14_0_8_um_filter_42_13]|nr:MAG: hypothetical protein COY92_07130 [Shewanella sp. CG_4_10_14_0_8_um_filter_42_13]
MSMNEPKNFRRIKTKSCLNCKFNIYDTNKLYRICNKTGESEWGEPEEMPNYVCDWFRKYEVSK